VKSGMSGVLFRRWPTSAAGRVPLSILATGRMVDYVAGNAHYP